MYTYKALDSSKHTRLLILDSAQDSAELRCSLISVLPSGETRYEALSYVWGDPTATRRIHVSGDELNITTNLHSALRHLRFEDRKRVLWVDAICIDQGNLDERGEQVKLMGQIYTQAEQVLVWLGEMTEDVELSLGLIAHLDEFIGKHDSGYAEGSIPYDQPRDGSILAGELFDMSETGFEWTSIIALLSRPWFERLWIVQEVIMARQAVMVCGYQTLPWAVVEKVFGALNMHGLLQYFAQRTGSFGFQNVATIGRLRQHHESPTRASLLLDLISDTSKFQSTDSRDRVFALLGLATNIGPEDTDITPNYNLLAEDVFKAMTLWNISRTKSLDSLSYSLPTSKRLALPSWVPDYTILHEADPLVKPGTQLPFNATKGSQPNELLPNDGKILQLHGLDIDTVELVVNIQAETAIPDSVLPLIRESILEEQDTEILIQTTLWINECERIASGADGGMSLERREEFRRTMILNRGAAGDLADPGSLLLVGRLVGHMNSMIFHNVDREFDPMDLEAISLVDRSLNKWQRHQQFCKTEKGRLGWVPHGAAIGDAICLFNGGRVPYVMRNDGRDIYEWVGECYIQGLMEGEAMPMETKTFSIK